MQVGPSPWWVTISLVSLSFWIFSSRPRHSLSVGYHVDSLVEEECILYITSCTLWRMGVSDQISLFIPSIDWSPKATSPSFSRVLVEAKLEVHVRVLVITEYCWHQWKVWKVYKNLVVEHSFRNKKKLTSIPEAAAWCLSTLHSHWRTILRMCAKMFL